LEDETLEVGEIHDVNSGRYKAPLFLKRSKVPKVNEDRGKDRQTDLQADRHNQKFLK
jgi:hypothetical protein